MREIVALGTDLTEPFLIPNVFIDPTLALSERPETRGPEFAEVAAPFGVADLHAGATANRDAGE